MIKPCLVALIALWIVSACQMDASCPTNEIFKKYSPDSREYKAELVRQLRNFDTEKLSYYIESFSEQNDKQYLLVVVNDDKLCAHITMDITHCNNDKLWWVKDKKGGGYSGAGLNHPKFRIDSADRDYKFILDDLSSISD